MRAPGALGRLASPQLRLPTQAPTSTLKRDTMRQPVPGPPPPTGSQHGASGRIFGRKSAGGTGGPNVGGQANGGKPGFTTQMWSTRTLVLLGTAVGCSTYIIGLNAGHSAGAQAAHKDTALGRAEPIIQPSGQPGADRGPNA